MKNCNCLQYVFMGMLSILFSACSAFEQTLPGVNCLFQRTGPLPHGSAKQISQALSFEHRLIETSSFETNKTDGRDQNGFVDLKTPDGDIAVNVLLSYSNGTIDVKVKPTKSSISLERMRYVADFVFSEIRKTYPSASGTEYVAKTGLLGP